MNGFLWASRVGPNAALRAERESISARHEATRAKHSTEELENAMEHLALACRAMWSLLTENTTLTDDDLLKRMEQIDLQDGRADGKVTGKIAKCPKCGRTMPPKRSKCMYCGATKLDYNPFDSV